MRKKAVCVQCGRTPLSRDEKGLSRKLLPPRTGPFCLECLSGHLEVTEEDLRYLVERFREEGCELFG